MNLQGQLLIATPDMNDSDFNRAVIYLCDHNEQGAMGLMINCPTDLSVMELLAKMDFMMASDRNYSQDQLVFNGGPVAQERGFILHTPIDSPLLHHYPIDEHIGLTTSGDILEHFGRSDSPEKFIVCLGCCTWKSGQLESEIARNDWFVAPASATLIFDTPYQERWVEAYQLMGIDTIPSKAGRA